MSLYETAARHCVRLERSAIPDGAGGSYTTWTDGETFVWYAYASQSGEKKTAEKRDAASDYTGLLEQGATLRYGDFFRDTVSGETFRVTNRPEEKQVPDCASSGLAGKQYLTADREPLPS